MYRHYNLVKSGGIANEKNYKLTKYLKNLIGQGLSPSHIKDTENLSDIEAYALEAALIEYYGLKNLCNLTEGGIIQNPMIGKHHTEATKQKVSAIASTPEKLAHAAECSIRGQVVQYDNGDYRKLFHRHFKKRLDADLRLLKQVIRDIRKSLTPPQPFRQPKQPKDRTAMIVLMDDTTKTYIRKCPQCSKHITNHHPQGFIQSLDLKRVCRQCRNNKIANWHQSHSAETSKKMLAYYYNSKKNKQS
jgi:hypothetical protein